jgi:hypothetical protein
MDTIRVKTGEGKTIRFTITEDGAAKDCSGATFKLGVKSSYEDSDYVLEKDDASFTKTQIASGIVTVNVTATETAALEVGQYDGELKIIFTADTDVDKSAIFNFNVERSIIHD